MTLLDNYFFEGGKADLMKGLSINPAFQVTHSFALGGQSSGPMGAVNAGTYNFGAVYVSDQVSHPR